MSFSPFHNIVLNILVRSTKGKKQQGNKSHKVCRSWREEAKLFKFMDDICTRNKDQAPSCYRPCHQSPNHTTTETTVRKSPYYSGPDLSDFRPKQEKKNIAREELFSVMERTLGYECSIAGFASKKLCDFDQLLYLIFASIASSVKWER